MELGWSSGLSWAEAFWRLRRAYALRSGERETAGRRLVSSCLNHVTDWSLLLAFRFGAEDAGEDFVDVFELAIEIEGVLDLLARDFGGDFFVGED